MEANEIHINDWARIFIGNVPGSFYIEIFIRLIVVYALLLISMRLMGKRISSSLSRNELAAVVVLAAGIGVPIQAPDRGLLPALIISIIVVLTEKGISGLAFKNQRFEKRSQGKISILIQDCVIDTKAMTETRISQERIMAQVRSKGLIHLGKVKRLYLEAGGDFVLIKNEKDEPGLSAIPEWDTDFRNAQKTVKEVTVCKNCGNRKTGAPECTNCGHNAWTYAII